MESVIRVCNRCGSLVQRSDIEEYEYQCLTCDEDLYTIETNEKPIPEDMEFYALQKDGIYEYGRDGDVILFESYEQAEEYILYAGFEEDRFNIVRIR